MRAKIKYLLIFVFCMFVFPLITNAECDYQRLADLNKIAGNVQFSYTYTPIENNLIFDVDISNITNDIYIVDNFDKTFNSNVTTAQYYPGAIISYVIYSNDSNCLGERITTKYLNLPFYNKYSSYPECKVNTNLSVCQFWGDQAILTDNEFYERIAKQETIQSDDDVIESKDSVLDVLYDNLIIIGLVVVGVSIVIVIVVRRKK